jgi:hypothetical protein
MAIRERVRSTAVGGAKRIVGAERWRRWRQRALLARDRWKDRRENRRFRRDGPCLLVVSEAGAPHAYREFLDWLVTHDPELRARIHLDRLPAPLPPDVALLHAWVRDPVRERDPRAFEQLSRLERAAERAGAGVVQPSRVLSHSLRDVLFARLSAAGVRTPRVVEVGPGFSRDFGGLALPVLVRHRWGHAVPMHLLESPGAVAAWVASEGGNPAGWVAAEFVDVRDADGCRRKYRYLMFGSRGICRHLIVSPGWEVRPKDRVLTDGTIAEELRFVAAPCAHHAVLDAARRLLEFDIAAFDYSLDPAGDLVVWEVNPYPDLSPPRGRPGEYLAATVEATYRMLAGYYRGRMGG